MYVISAQIWMGTAAGGIGLIAGLASGDQATGQIGGRAELLYFGQQNSVMTAQGLSLIHI